MLPNPSRPIDGGGRILPPTGFAPIRGRWLAICSGDGLRNDERRLGCHRSNTQRPKLIFALLISLILPEGDSATIPYGPGMDLWRRPISTAALCTFRAQNDHAVVPSEHLIDSNFEGAFRQPHKVIEKSQNFRVPAVIARQRSAARNMPGDVRGEYPQRALNIAPAESLVTAYDQCCILLCFCHVQFLFGRTPPHWRGGIVGHQDAALRRGTARGSVPLFFLVRVPG